MFSKLQAPLRPLAQLRHKLNTSNDEIPHEYSILKQDIEDFIIDLLVLLEIVKDDLGIIGLFVDLVTNHLTNRNILVAKISRQSADKSISQLYTC